METIIAKRKIILQSGSSHMITLPKEFCLANGWYPGKEVIIKTDGKRLILELAESGDKVEGASRGVVLT